MSPGSGPVRRILVGVDASPASLAALDAALRLAAELGAELDALFVEDVNMLHFAGLPFTRVVDAYSAAPRAFDPADMERALRARAEQTRQRLAEAAGTRVAWTFRVVRGNVEGEVLAAARESDLLSLGFFGDRPAGGRGAGSLARRAVRDAPGSVMLLRQPGPVEGPVVVCLDEGPEGERALATAAPLARAHGGTLTAVTFGGDDERARRLELAASEQLAGSGVKTRFVRVPAAGRHGLKSLLPAVHGGVLVVSPASDLVKSGAIDDLIEECPCSLLIAR